MGTESVLKNEHFMVCLCAEKHKISALQVAFLLRLNREECLQVLTKHFMNTLSLEDTQTF
jgi:hypothetical protein